MSKSRLAQDIFNISRKQVLTSEAQYQRVCCVFGVQNQYMQPLQGQVFYQQRYYSSDGLKKTALYDFHVKNGGTMVPFAGWSMPVKYKDSVNVSVKHTREKASLFDVSHMCGVTVEGKDAIKFVESLTVVDAQSFEDGSGGLSLFLNEKGGIIDDTIVSRVNGNKIYLVVNAGCKDKDVNHMESKLKEFQNNGGDAQLQVHQQRGLLALQGPLSQKVLEKLSSKDLSSFYFGQYKEINVCDVPCWITRGGYTGEDGFEISTPPEGTIQIAESLNEDSTVMLAGLGARDILRLEAGLCLYGNDIDESKTPIEASLTWAVAKRRREAKDFPGHQVVLQQLKEGIQQRRVPIIGQEGPPIRQHAKIFTKDGKEEIGEVTSGSPSTTINKNIAMGYIQKPYDKSGTQILIETRGKKASAVVTKGAFVQTKYHRP